MRPNYPISSQELMDKIELNQESLIYLLGYNDGSIIVSGLYDLLEASGTDLYFGASGIPHMDDEGILSPLVAPGLEDNYKAGIYHNYPKKWSY